MITNIKNKYSRMKYRLFLFFSIPLSLIITGQIVYASDTLTILEKNQQYLEQCGITNNILREIGWKFTIFLKWVCDSTETLLKYAYKLIDFTEYSGIDGFISKNQPILYMIFALALLVYGISKITSPESNKKIFNNIIVLILVITCLSTFMSMANSLVTSSKSYLTTDNESESYGSDKILSANTVDLKVLDKNNFDIKKCSSPSGMNSNPKAINYIDINETIDSNDEGIINKELFTKKFTQEDGVVGITDIDPHSGWLDFFPAENYYRYSVDFISSWISLLAMIFVYIFSSYKVVRLIFELAVQKTVAPLFAAGDIASGKKVKQVINAITGSYIILVIIMLLQKVFIIFNAYIQTKDINSFVKAFFLLCVALAVIDGPNIFEQIFGIDAGLRSAFQVYAVAKSGKAVASGLASGVKNGINKSAGVVGGVSGAISGKGSNGMSPDLGNKNNLSSMGIGSGSSESNGFSQKNENQPSSPIENGKNANGFSNLGPSTGNKDIAKEEADIMNGARSGLKNLMNNSNTSNAERNQAIADSGSNLSKSESSGATSAKSNLSYDTGNNDNAIKGQIENETTPGNSQAVAQAAQDGNLSNMESEEEETPNSFTNELNNPELSQSVDSASVSDTSNLASGNINQVGRNTSKGNSNIANNKMGISSFLASNVKNNTDIGRHYAKGKDFGAGLRNAGTNTVENTSNQIAHIDKSNINE